MEGLNKNIPQDLIDRMKSAGCGRFTFYASGGSDEGYFDVVGWEERSNVSVFLDELVEAIASDYSVDAAEGDYGTDIEFDLHAMTATHKEWHMEASYAEPSTQQIAPATEAP